MSEERKKLDLAYGAQMVYTPGAESDVTRSAEARVDPAAAPEEVLRARPVREPDNVEAHVKTTGPEIWEQTAGRIDAFIMTQGTGGTLTGVGRYIRRRRKALRLYAIEPSECPCFPPPVGAARHRRHRRRVRAQEPRRQLLDGIVTTTTE